MEIEGITISDDVFENKHPSRKMNTETDMEVSMIANSEKLITEDKRWHYKENKGEPETERIDVTETVGKLEPDKKGDDIMKEIENIEKDEYKSDNKGPTYGEYIHVDTNPNPNQVDIEEDREIKRLKRIKNGNVDFNSLPEEDKKIKKMHMLRRLGELKRNGVRISHNYKITDDYHMMRYEYELHMSIRKKAKMVDMFESALYFLVSKVEEFNVTFNHIGLNIEGWTEDIKEKQEDIREALDEIYEIYFPDGSGSSNPIARLGLILCTTAWKRHSKNVGSKQGISLGNNVEKFFGGKGGENLDRVRDNEKIEYLNELRCHQEEHKKQLDLEKRRLDGLEKMRENLYISSNETEDIPMTRSGIDVSNINNDVARALEKHRQLKGSSFNSSKSQEISNNSDNGSVRSVVSINRDLDDAIRRSSIAPDDISFSSKTRSRKSRKTKGSRKSSKSKHGAITFT